METKDRILEQALGLFSEKGYDAVSVREIADAVGMKAPSLYKHFKSKQDIFDSILEESNGRYRAFTESMQMDGSDAGIDASLLGNLSPALLAEKVKGLFLFFLNDEWISRIRKLLTIEGYRNKELSKLYSELYFDGPINYQKEIFRVLTKAGALKGDPDVMAVEFYSSIYMLLLEAERSPEREPEILDILRAHVISFAVSHGGRE